MEQTSARGLPVNSGEAQAPNFRHAKTVASIAKDESRFDKFPVSQPWMHSASWLKVQKRPQTHATAAEAPRKRVTITTHAFCRFRVTHVEILWFPSTNQNRDKPHYRIRMHQIDTSTECPAQPPPAGKGGELLLLDLLCLTTTQRDTFPKTNIEPEQGKGEWSSRNLCTGSMFRDGRMDTWHLQKDHLPKSQTHLHKT